jgi:hypothetical protein
MEREFWIRELGRLFKRSSEAIRHDDTKAVKILVDEFNESLSNLQEEYPNNQIIESITPVDSTEEKFLMGSVSRTGETSTSTYEGIREEALYEIRSNCERIANSLGYELPDARQESEESKTDQMVVVQMKNTQESHQEVTQNVTVESVIELIKHDPQAQRHQDELTELTEKIKEELDSDDPDESTIREYISEAKEYSVSVAAKLSMLALQAGVIGVLGL